MAVGSAFLSCLLSCFLPCFLSCCLAFLLLFLTKLAFSVLTVNGNGSSFMKQMVFGVVTAMDLLTFVSRNDKK